MFRNQNIKKIRQKKGWSFADVVYELAQLSHRYTRQTICNWELGVTEPKASDIACLAEAFGVKPQFFFEDAKQVAPYTGVWIETRGEVMADQVFRDLKESIEHKIEHKMVELEELQKKHIHETGRRYVAPLRLRLPKKNS